MENKQNLQKGELMEELLRNYFLALGYYVVRGVKFRYENEDVTDVDLYLYGRASILTRERINVDIKNKKSPQAYERTLLATGIKDILGFDSCIVATTETKPTFLQFAQAHSVTVLDGNFLAKMRVNTYPNRLTEEELMSELAQKVDHKNTRRDWRYLHELAKSKLLYQLDFASFNELLELLKYYFNEVMSDVQKRSLALRMVFITIGQLLIVIDFILKDLSFLEQERKEKVMINGLQFGNLGKEGAERIIDIASKIAGKPATRFLKDLENPAHLILNEFFLKNDNSKFFFVWAKELESVGYERNITNPDVLGSPLKAVLSLFLDFFQIERKIFFDLFQRQP